MFREEIFLPVDLHETVKQRAGQLSCSFSEALADLIRRGWKSLKQERREAARSREEEFLFLLMKHWHMSGEGAEQALVEVERIALAELQVQM